MARGGVLLLRGGGVAASCGATCVPGLRSAGARRRGRVAACCCYVVGAWGRRAGECASEGCGLQGRLVGARGGERGRSEAPSPAWGSPCVRVFRFVLFLTHRP